MKRVIVYVDGFNFYYSLRKSRAKGQRWKRFYWLDLISLFNSYLDPKVHELVTVKYFTARQMNADKVKRQGMWLTTLKKLYPNQFEVVYGRYKEKSMYCPLHCSFHGNQKTYRSAEEKETDVNISIHMISDCYENKVDNIILVTGDSDQTPTCNQILKTFPKKKLKLYFPPNQNSYYSSALSSIVGKKDRVYMDNQRAFFEKSILPDTLQLDGKSFTIPPKWKRFQ